PSSLVAARGRAVIELHEVRRRYGERVALDGVSFTVAAGECVGLLGANGAGKSTLLRTAAGLLPPDDGHVRMGGVDLWKTRGGGKRRSGYMAGGPPCSEGRSGGESLPLVAGIRGLDAGAARARADALCDRLGLDGRTAEPVHRFSHGMRKKLSFVAAVLH